MRPRKKITREEGDRLFQAMTEEKRARPKKRLLCVCLALHFGLPTPEVAKRVGFSEGTVRNLCSRYHWARIEAVRGKAKGGRRNEYLTPDEEWKFLGMISAQAKAGRDPLPVKMIKRLYEKQIRRRVAASTIYRLLKRNHYPLDLGQMLWKMGEIRYSDLHP
jgi:transposase